MENEIKNYKGFIGIVRPGEDKVIFEDYEFDTSDEGKNNALVKIIELVTKKEDSDELGKVANSGYLPSPFNEFTMFMNFDQFDPDIKYNLGFFGTPVFGTMVFLQVDINSEEGTIIPIEENKKRILSENIEHFKKFEKDTGIYDSMCKTDKNKFLEEFVKEKNNILEESTKDIKGNNYEELQDAKRELEETLNKD